MTAPEISVLRVLLRFPNGVQHWDLPGMSGFSQRDVSNAVEALSEMNLIAHDGARWVVTEKGRSQYEKEAPKPGDLDVNWWFVGAVIICFCLIVWGLNKWAF